VTVRDALQNFLDLIRTRRTRTRTHEGHQYAPGQSSCSITCPDYGILADIGFDLFWRESSCCILADIGFDLFWRESSCSIVTTDQANGHHRPGSFGSSVTVYVSSQRRHPTSQPIGPAMSRSESVQPPSSTAKHRKSRRPRGESAQPPWQAGLSTLRDVTGTVLLLSPLFIALKALVVSGFNSEIAVPLVSSLTVATYVQVVAIYALPIVLMVASIYCFAHAGVRAKTKFDLIVLWGTVCLITLSMVVLSSTLPYPRAFHVTKFTVEVVAILFLVGGFVLTGILQNPSVLNLLGIQFLGWLCLLVVWFSSDYMTALAVSFLPIFTLGGLDVVRQNRKMKTWAIIAGRLFVVTVALLVVLGSGLWLQPEKMIISGSEVTAYEIRAKDEGSVLFVLNGRSVEHVSKNQITYRQFCRYTAGTVGERLVPAGRSMPQCPPRAP
jgi:hypothetical protein